MFASVLPDVCFARCLWMVNFYGRDSLGFSGVVSLVSLSWCSRFAFFLFVWALLLHLVFYLLVVPLLVVSLLQQVN